MTPTNEQIIAEAHRRWLEEQRDNDGLTPEGSSLANHVINVMREGWTPPEPVDPDILAFREWFIGIDPFPNKRTWVDQGYHDNYIEAQAYLAGARMAREKERERAGKTITMAKELAATYRLFLQRLPLDFRAQLGVKCEVDEGFTKDVAAEIAKYEEGSR